MIELIKSIIKNSNERLKNPITGSFLISFIFYNWKSFSILTFSNETIEKRINEIEITYKNPFCDAYLIPITFSILYVTILPYIKWFFDWIKNHAEMKVLKIQSDYKTKILNDELNHAEIERKINEEKLDLKMRVDEYKLKLSQLETEISTLTNNHDSLANRFQKMDGVYTLLISQNITLAQEIGKYLKTNLSIEERQFLKEFHPNTSIPINQEHIALLIRANYLTKDNAVFNLTEEGDKFIGELS